MSEVKATTMLRRAMVQCTLCHLQSSANTTPGYTRPVSETNSLGQSCSSALSGVDDTRLDELLGDGIKGQRLNENKVELLSLIFVCYRLILKNNRIGYKTCRWVS